MTLACSDWMGPIVWAYRFSTGGGKRHTESERGYENERGIEQERGREIEDRAGHALFHKERESALLG